MGLIYLDSCLVIYVVERHSVWSKVVAEGIAHEPDARFAVSPLVKLECLVSPVRQGDLPLERDYEAFFDRVITLDMSELVFIDAARLRAHFGLRTPDALHIACAQRHRCDALWTNDHRLSAAAGTLARVLTPPQA